MAAEHFLATANVLPEPMLLTTPEGVIEAANRAFFAHTPLQAADIRGRTLQSLVTQSAEQVQEYLRICARNSHMIPGALTLRAGERTLPYRCDGASYRVFPEGAPICVLLRLRARHEAGGAFVTLTDKIQQLNAQIARREQVEETLRRESETLRVTLASIGDAVVVTDASGRITFLNVIAQQLTGWPLGDARGRPLAEVFRIVNEKTRQPVADPVAKVLQSGAILGLANHTVLLARDGRELPIDDSAAPIRLPNGDLAGVVLIFRDITERRRADQARARLAAVVESSDDAIVSKTLDGIITSWNRGAQQLFGYRPEEMIGRTITTIIPPELQDEEAEILARLRRGERIDHFDTLRIAKDGRRIEISLTVSPIRDESGGIIGASKVARDISERKRAEEQLREADRQKDEFLATLAHELRNPLAPIRNAAALICRMDLQQPARSACEIIERQIQQLTHLVDDLLDVSRITAGRVRVEAEPLELSEVVALAVESCRPALEAARHELRIEPSTHSVWAMADRVRLPQVLANVLHNAIKYTPSGGRIRMKIEREHDQAVIRIQDTGIGIAREMLTRIFELFVQVDRAYETTGGGLGVGLTLAKRLMQLQGGSIEAHSEGPSKGSEFILRLPAAAAPSAASVSSGTRPGSRATPSALRILIADDNVDAALSLAMFLQMDGHDTRVVHDGEAALTVAEGWHPQVVVLDIGMPRLNGYLAVQKMVRRPWAAQTFFVAITGWGQHADRQRALEAGFHLHLVKPVEPDALARLFADRFPH
jgi:PAS domain S-box-containing protein